MYTYIYTHKHASTYLLRGILVPTYLPVCSFPTYLTLLPAYPADLGSDLPDYPYLSISLSCTPAWADSESGSRFVDKIELHKPTQASPRNSPQLLFMQQIAS